MTAPTPPPDAAVRVLLATAPPGTAHDLARRLVEEGLAACVNVVPGVRSVYRWQGKVLDDPETLLVIKTAAERVPDLQRRFLALHPYEVPELLVLSPSGGSEAYLGWVREATAAPVAPADGP